MALNLGAPSFPNVLPRSKFRCELCPSPRRESRAQFPAASPVAASVEGRRGGYMERALPRAELPMQEQPCSPCHRTGTGRSKRVSSRRWHPTHSAFWRGSCPHRGVCWQAAPCSVVRSPSPEKEGGLWKGTGDSLGRRPLQLANIWPWPGWRCREADEATLCEGHCHQMGRLLHVLIPSSASR